MWDWISSAADTVGSWFDSGSAGVSAADAAASTVDQTNVATSATSWGNLDLNAFDQAGGGTSGSGYNANSGWNWGSLASGASSALKSASGLLNPTASGVNSYTTKTTTLPGSQATAQDKAANAGKGNGLNSQDPRAAATYWYNLMKQFAYAGK